jgi:hypothetical protein
VLSTAKLCDTLDPCHDQGRDRGRDAARPAQRATRHLANAGDIPNHAVAVEAGAGAEVYHVTEAVHTAPAPAQLQNGHRSDTAHAPDPHLQWEATTAVHHHHHHRETSTRRLTLTLLPLLLHQRDTKANGFRCRHLFLLEAAFRRIGRLIPLL